MIRDREAPGLAFGPAGNGDEFYAEGLKSSLQTPAGWPARAWTPMNTSADEG